jgi:hypothetical protein
MFSVSALAINHTELLWFDIPTSLLGNRRQALF